MNRTKLFPPRLTFALFALLAPLVFTSCIDYVQSVSYKDGAYHLYYKITVSKVLFALSGEDPEELFEGFDGDVFSELPDEVEANPVNTDLEVGAEFAFSVSPKTTDKTEKPFLPTVAGNKCYIPFLLGEYESETGSLADIFDADSEYESIVEAILSSAKCRVMVSKSVIANHRSSCYTGNMLARYLENRVSKECRKTGISASDSRKYVSNSLQHIELRRAYSTKRPDLRD